MGSTGGSSGSGAESVEERFASGGSDCAARVYRPAGAVRPGSAGRPVVVMGHGFGGVRVLRLYAYAERFAAAGYVVVVFDYRGFGQSGGDPRQVVDVRMQLQDWGAALAFARAVPGVDPDRVVAWGTSFAGGHVISLAGRGEQLAAIVPQVPHLSGPAAVRATGPAAALRLLPPAVRDQVAALRGRAPVHVPAVGAPGETAIMTAPGALAATDRLVAESGLAPGDYVVDVAARIALKIGAYSPARVASRVTCPALVQVATLDAITPPRAARKAASRMARATVHVYDGGHFDPYVAPLFDRVVDDQLAFLREHVPVAG